MKLITLFSLFVVLLSYLIRARFMEVFMNKNFGSGYEQSDLSGEVIDTDLTTEDLVAIAQDQIAANQTIIDQIRQGQIDIQQQQDVLANSDQIGQFLSDLHPEVLDDDQPDFMDENWEEYHQWLIESQPEFV